MTIRSTSGISVSVCQTVTGATPEILVRAAIMSRSRLRPGSWTTADFMGAVQTLLVLPKAHVDRGGLQFFPSARPAGYAWRKDCYCRFDGREGSGASSSIHCGVLAPCAQTYLRAN